jgi:predicted house-cleaning noncanonical NTP pyrophosphatase (MazG superfamily)
MLVGKLVRDRIPELLLKDGKTPISYRLKHPMEIKQCLVQKLVEEIDEYVRDADRTELADVMEVLQALIKVEYPDGGFEADLTEKRLANGGLETLTFLCAFEGE